MCPSHVAMIPTGLYSARKEDIDLGDISASLYSTPWKHLNLNIDLDFVQVAAIFGSDEPLRCMGPTLGPVQHHGA